MRQTLGVRVKEAIFRAGAGRAYLNNWWRHRVRSKSPWTQWNFENSAVFIHVPKTAGMSVYKTLDMPMAVETHCPVEGYRAADPEAWAKCYSFAFVRNPWDRFVSAYHYLKEKPISDDDKRFAAETLSGFDTFQQFAAAMSDSSFRAKIMMWRHFTPQWYFVTDRSGHVAVTELARFEGFGENIQKIAARFGKEVEPARENIVKRKKYTDFFDPGSRSLIGELYKEDIELFNYSYGE